MKCEHKWVDVNDRTYDQFCTKCGLKQMQNAMAMTVPPISQPIAQPIVREKIEVPFYNGSEHTRISVYKDELMEQLRKEQGLTINHGLSLGC
ncbi:hypothetical protein [Lederbergia galactosidilytica]|uniref:Uncharacterized protein n=1 Tax=Lederbergia galactosidilytica TaxID=217031 RepID=A0A177ZXM4_9BACI|nr:hypothetical protein [Lederbergia galactosidilytica]OAK72686.1 hypothetical protein ABB05_07460 [Lederbergia galactosidilytica]